MAKTKKEAGSEFLKGVLALIPEDKRTAVQEVLSADPIVESLGAPLVEFESKAEKAIADAAQKDQIVGTYKQNLDKWYQQTLADLDAGNKARAELEKLKKEDTLITPTGDDTITAKLPANMVTKEDLQKHITEALATSEQGAVTMMAYLTTLATNHYKNFGEALDTSALIRNAQQAGKRVDVYYNELVQPRVTEMEKKRADEHDAQIRKEEREKVRAEIAKQTGHRAYPLPGTMSEDPTTLAGLKGSNGKEQSSPDFGVKAALDEFYAKGQNIGS